MQSDLERELHAGLDAIDEIVLRYRKSNAALTAQRRTVEPIYRIFFVVSRHQQRCAEQTVICRIFGIRGRTADLSYSLLFTACAVATSCCISDVPFQWEGRNFIKI